MVADTWLEYVFGWEPLVNDINDGARALANYKYKDLKRPKYLKAVATVEDSEILDCNEANVGACQFHGEWHQVKSFKTIYRGVYAATSTFPLPIMAPKLFGFNLREFVPTVWELLPYSFLIDYFTNIGDILNAWSYQRFGLAWSNRTQIRKIDWKLSITPNYKSSFFTYEPWQPIGVSFTAPHCHMRRKEISRGSYEGNFVPDIQFEIPGFKSKKWLNIAALFATSHGIERTLQYRGR
jgi:hypothetical protein